MIYGKVEFCEMLKMINEKKKITVLLFPMKRRFRTSQRTRGKSGMCASWPVHQHAHSRQLFGRLARPWNYNSSLQIALREPVTGNPY